MLTVNSRLVLFVINDTAVAFVSTLNIATIAQGTVLIKTANELMDYSKGEESQVEEVKMMSPDTLTATCLVHVRILYFIFNAGLFHRTVVTFVELIMF